MEADPQRLDDGREIRLEGPGLLAFAGLLVILLAGAFLFGRWSAPSGGETASATDRAADPAPLDRAAAPSEKVSVFDSGGASGKTAEPQRQVTPPISKAAGAPAPSSTPGPWVVQVFAGRDREAAETLVRGLTDRGYPVRIESTHEGNDLLFKVRVGGYPTQADANAAAERLRREGEAGAWVTRAK